MDIKKSGFAIFVFLAVLCAYSAEQENPQKTSGWNFGIEGIFGARFGKEGEIVWGRNSKNGEKYKLSELEWWYAPALYAGAKIDSGYKRFEISVSSIFFLPITCGAMKDSDWNQDNGYQTGNTSIKTNYSESDNKISNGFELELSLAFKFYPTHFLTLRPNLSVSYQRMEFDAMGGTLWYGNPKGESSKGSYYPYDDRNHSYSQKLPYEPVITYSLQNLYLWTGIRADFLPARNIVLSLTTEAAPIAYMNSHDHHVLKHTVYRNKSLSAFFAVRQSARAQFTINDTVSVALNLRGLLTGETVGTVYEKRQGESVYKTFAESGGAYSLCFDIGISARFAL